jgi:ketosteroid isomerase-like protein
MKLQLSRSIRMVLCSCMAIVAGCASAPHAHENAARAILPGGSDGAGCHRLATARPDALRTVLDTECAFAKTMADRDFKAFAVFLDENAVFFNKDGALLGKDAVLQEWKPYFDAAAAPFSWEPTRVAWDNKAFAYTTGPVYDAGGKCVARFNSIWHKHADGHWRIVFDKGDSGCDPALVPGGGASEAAGN